MIKPEDLQTECSPTWCPGCGNFGIWGALRNAALKMGWDNTNSVLVAGIGCHGNITNFIKLTSFEGLHGRALPVATGIKLANHKLNVFVFSGDGDCFGEGGNHFIHTCRRNHDLTLFIHNNGLYGLTTGQTSPLSPLGFKSKSTPQGNLEQPFSPLALAIASGATFVARGYTSDLPQLTELIIKANKHKGFAVLDILQPCITWNKDYTPIFFKENTYQLTNHDVKDKEAALKKSMEWALPLTAVRQVAGRQGPKQIPLGIFYQVDQPTFESRLPQISQKTLVENPPKININDLLKKYT